ncbi:ABC transporter permease subunit [Paenibacillus campinasensis]|uniref:ABC transporter permease subunit n=1 Tax=Paenibacillus campinasensis TaxID=66347 RepID=A0ABW9T514_9BACL|nr:ABC transporter permease [Paenibacillus campinasensis]MUG68189.1 ABC transporter permease subunit [Paenibacillus campinasensis]
MRSFGYLLWNEWLKMFKKRSFFIPYLLLAGMVIFVAFILSEFAQGTVDGYGFAEMALSTRGMGAMLTLLAIVMTAGTVSKEHSMGTIKFLLIRAQTRTQILASKYVMVLIYSATLVVFLGIAAVLTGQLVFGPVDGPGATSLSEVLRAGGYNMVYTTIYVTLAFTAGILTRSTGSAIGIGMFMIVAESLAVQLLARYSWAKYLLFFNVDLSMYDGGAGAVFPGMSLMFSIIVLAAYLLFFLMAGFITFHKRDVA